ncbi:FAD-binding protein [Lactiplantibacillus paraplantarum]|uniref:FAD-binding protein n=1 Tax=Lactiplantibacillus paraplantarum TaxID=60520 RepID=UPI0023AA39C0|nr:FAD-binding protein [Lactiplantibacillus paraplantarum]WEE36731.1 FAD-binding protein [Lactiplantibacillus paraplantarum]
MDFERVVSMLKKMNQVKWDYQYDTVVIGFGGAGATAARFAADAHAKVLLTDAAPNGHEGGNTRYSAQLLGTVDSFDEGKKYYQNLTAPMQLDDSMVDTFVAGMANMRDYVQKYLNVEPVSVKNDFTAADSPISLDSAVHEFPEFDGVQSYDFTTVHHGIFDAALWKILRQKVLDRQQQIDVWLSAPAQHLIQDPATNTIIGVQIERQHRLVNVRATNGVVLACGGFENNQQAIQDYLGAEHLAPLGTLFNKGAGIKMAQEVGADFWHMQNYESLGFLHGLSIAVPQGKRGRLILGWPEVNHGSVITVADDGSRYFDESEANRHGHIYDHGMWRVPRTNVHPYLVFDETQYQQMLASQYTPINNLADLVVKATTLNDLARVMEADGTVLTKTVHDFNYFVESGTDYAFNRQFETMRAFDDGPYYALKLTNNVLNTQGGPRRNDRAEILDANQQPIPHLYGAGELGGICANQYQGGGNLAECLIFGKIAGENAAKPKEETTQLVDEKAVAKPDANTSASVHQTSANDLLAEASPDITVGEHQYLGRSDDGIGGQVVVRITYVDQQLTNVEVVEQHETGEVGGQAVAELPAKMVAANTYDVDAVSGASVSSRAIKAAVKAALSQAEQTVSND